MGLSKIPSPTEWQDRTKVFGGVRGQQMAAVDAAIGEYSKAPTDAAKAKIRIALQAWKLSKGVNWKSDERNKSGIISDLDTFLDPQGANGVAKSVLTTESTESLKFVREHAQKSLYDLFHPDGKSVRLTWKLFSGQEYVQITGSDGKAQDLRRLKADMSHTVKQGQRTHTAFGQVQSGASSLQTMAKPIGITFPSAPTSALSDQLKTDILSQAAKLLDVSPGDASSIVEEVLVHVGLPVLANFVADCVPFLSVVKDGAVVGKKIVEYGLKRHTMSTVKQHAYIMAKGSPKEALDAIQDMLKDESKDIRNDGLKAAASGATGAVGHFFSAGAAAPLLAAAKAMVNLLLLLNSGLQDYKTIRKTNTFLQTTTGSSDTFAKKLFDKAPLLACYYVMIAETSTLLDVLGDNFGTTSWQRDVELYAKKLDGMRSEAARMISSARFTVQGMQKHRLAASASKLAAVKMAALAFTKTAQDADADGMGSAVSSAHLTSV